MGFPSTSGYSRILGCAGGDPDLEKVFGWWPQRDTWPGLETDPNHTQALQASPSGAAIPPCLELYPGNYRALAGFCSQDERFLGNWDAVIFPELPARSRWVAGKNSAVPELFVCLILKSPPLVVLEVKNVPRPLHERGNPGGNAFCPLILRDEAVMSGRKWEAAKN